MRHAVILAGGAGTRLWPMSRRARPKQIIPFMEGRSLLEEAFNRLDGLVDKEKRKICAGQDHRDAVAEALPDFSPEAYIGEPCGRDTLSALALSTAVIRQEDPDAVIAVFTSDHIIKPEDSFRSIIDRGYQIVEESAGTIVTFGIEPSGPATGFGYLELGSSHISGSKKVTRFREKPDSEKAQEFFDLGPEKYLWNSGMFIWNAAQFLDCVKQYESEVFQGISKIAEAWYSEGRQAVLEKIYPELKKISVDYAVMEPASADPGVTVAALSMPLFWKDIGSWTAFSGILKPDSMGNTVSAGSSLLMDSSNTLIYSSDDDHLIACLGCSDLMIIHSGNATLICPKSRDQDIKKLHREAGERFGDTYI